MAVVYDTPTKTSRMTATRDAVCGGTSGTLEICTAGYGAVLALFTLTTAGGTVTNDVWTLAFTASTVTGGGGGGVAAIARLKNNGGTVKISGLTVGTSGSDINLNSTTIGVGSNVTLSSATITHAA